MTKNVYLTKFTCTVRMSVSNGNTPQFSIWTAVLFQFQNENKQTNKEQHSFLFTTPFKTRSPNKAFENQSS